MEVGVGKESEEKGVRQTLSLRFVRIKNLMWDGKSVE